MRRQKKKNKWGILLVLLLIQSFLAYFLLQKGWAPQVGFLIKSDKEFVVAWMGEHRELHYSGFPSLEKALSFIGKDLKLETAHQPSDEMTVEHLWLEDRFGQYQLLWKTSKLKFLHQITFQNEKVARFFAEAFKSGAYSTSPFGHSILLRPQLAGAR